MSADRTTAMTRTIVKQVALRPAAPMFEAVRAGELTSLDELPVWLKGSLSLRPGHPDRCVEIWHGGRWVALGPDDWILHDVVRGGVWPCVGDVFRAVYEEVTIAAEGSR